MLFVYVFWTESIKPMLIYSLNSLSVRVPHNSSRRVLQTQTPNPLLEAGGWWLAVAGTGFTVKPMVFQYLSASLLVKPMVFQQFRLPDL